MNDPFDSWRLTNYLLLALLILAVIGLLNLIF